MLTDQLCRQDDAVLVLAAGCGLLRPARPAWNPEDPVGVWLEIGRCNPWIRAAWDPPFDRRSFFEAADLDALEERLEHGNWSLGQAFHLGELCFINQVNGGDEWLTIRRNLAFESISAEPMIATGRFRAFIADILAASPDECRRLAYDGARVRYEAYVERCRHQDRTPFAPGSDEWPAHAAELAAATP